MEDTAKTTTTRRRRVTADKPVNSDLANVELIRAGDWRKVFDSVGSAEYNRLRCVALK